jgi:hypothetical protein
VIFFLNGRGVKLTTNLHLVPKLKNGEAIPPFPHMSSRRGGELIKPRDTFTSLLPYKILGSYTAWYQCCLYRVAWL